MWVRIPSGVLCTRDGIGIHTGLRCQVLRVRVPPGVRTYDGTGIHTCFKIKVLRVQIPLGVLKGESLVSNAETFTKEEVFEVILNRRKEILERIKTPSGDDNESYIFSLKVRCNEIGHILDALGYDKYIKKDEDIEELLK